MTKTCDMCEHHIQATYPATLGTCNYPVPQWIKNGGMGSGFVNGYEASQCSTFEDKQEQKEVK